MSGPVHDRLRDLARGAHIDRLLAATSLLSNASILAVASRNLAFHRSTIEEFLPTMGDAPANLVKALSKVSERLAASATRHPLSDARLRAMVSDPDWLLGVAQSVSHLWQMEVMPVLMGLCAIRSIDATSQRPGHVLKIIDTVVACDTGRARQGHLLVHINAVLDAMSPPTSGSAPVERGTTACDSDPAATPIAVIVWSALHATLSVLVHGLHTLFHPDGRASTDAAEVEIEVLRAAQDARKLFCPEGVLPSAALRFTPPLVDIFGGALFSVLPTLALASFEASRESGDLPVVSKGIRMSLRPESSSDDAVLRFAASMLRALEEDRSPSAGDEVPVAHTLSVPAATLLARMSEAVPTLKSADPLFVPCADDPGAVGETKGDEDGDGDGDGDGSIEALASRSAIGDVIRTTSALCPRFLSLRSESPRFRMKVTQWIASCRPTLSTIPDPKTDALARELETLLNRDDVVEDVADTVFARSRDFGTPFTMVPPLVFVLALCAFLDLVQ